MDFVSAFFGRAGGDHRTSEGQQAGWWEAFAAALIGRPLVTTDEARTDATSPSPSPASDREVEQEPTGTEDSSTYSLPDGPNQNINFEHDISSVSRVDPADDTRSFDDSATWQANAAVRSPRFVERNSVTAFLEEQSAASERGPVVLVSAPAGYGKTTEIAAWVAATPNVRTSWISLDESDREARAWCRSVVAAMSPQAPANSALHHLSSALPESDVVATLLDAIRELPMPQRLIIDDIQTIIGYPAERALQALVRDAVPGFTIVICGRGDPEIDLDQLRLQDRLWELRVDRLAFTVADATRLFEQAALDLSPAQITPLVERSEGWPAALRLVSLSLRENVNLSSVLDDFVKEHRPDADSLAGELMASSADPRSPRTVTSTDASLDERERAVLELLPTLRQWEGLAEDLAISTDTVKTHVRVLYEKLGVGRREGGDARARRAGMAARDDSDVG